MSCMWLNGGFQSQRAPDNGVVHSRQKCRFPKAILKVFSEKCFWSEQFKVVPKASFNFDHTKVNLLSHTILSRTLKICLIVDSAQVKLLTVGYSTSAMPVVVVTSQHCIDHYKWNILIYFALKMNACIHDSWPQQQVETCVKNIAASSSSCTVVTALQDDWYHRVSLTFQSLTSHAESAKVN